ncbi:MAG: hypothetical protein ACXVCE_16625, partial [Bacteriovorax sp.]
MKILSILFLISISFWSPKEARTEEFGDMTSIEKAEKEIDVINIKFQNPLRDVDVNLESYTNLLATFKEFKQFDELFVNN